MKKTLRAIGAGTLGLAAVAAMAMPAAAQEEPGPEPGDIVEITLEGCDIVVTFLPDADSTFHVEVWDDGAQIGDVVVQGTEGETTQGRYKLTSVVKQGASGLGITLTDADGGYLDGVDPYNGADDVIDFCAAQDLEPEPEPAPEPVLETNIEPAVAVAAVAVVADPDYTG